ncbi:hypothetical protein [Photobacterium sanguinicancri]|uniref:Flavoprotein domain-containing protein n=1 Tax=Photobacterium sanguinicancri TaxID=875932 RepID=A0AAW7Y385_9GAMM|nr:hypothetical protein [Photobacterium sanguinicancri]MDO6541889.1 hypothetical protein [Photobacterium sanguinicancri]
MSEQGFNDSTINTIVEQVLAKMGKPTLIVLTAANGYHHEIANQLATWQGIHWHILASQNSNQNLKNELMAVQHLGTQAHWDGTNPSEWLNQYEQILFPYLDFATLGEVSNGMYLSPAAVLFQYALMKGMPTYVLDYQCDLTSELNQLLGLSTNAAMCERAKQQLVTITTLGAKSGSLTDIKAVMQETKTQGMALNKPETPSVSTADPLSGYITLNEVKSKGVNAYTLQDNLTDLAAEYIKEQQQ